MAELMCRVQTTGGNYAEEQTATTHGETCAHPRHRIHAEGDKAQHH